MFCMLPVSDQRRGLSRFRYSRRAVPNAGHGVVDREFSNVEKHCEASSLLRVLLLLLLRRDSVTMQLKKYGRRRSNSGLIATAGRLWSTSRCDMLDHQVHSDRVHHTLHIITAHIAIEYVGITGPRMLCISHASLGGVCSLR